MAEESFKLFSKNAVDDEVYGRVEGHQKIGDLGQVGYLEANHLEEENWLYNVFKWARNLEHTPCIDQSNPGHNKFMESALLQSGSFGCPGRLNGQRSLKCQLT